ncbi:MAG: flagellar biosynthesis protein FliQ [Alphaproteobacteria bacterium]|nr:flagellar biosynthesis protein FliQ [Alphaproteobacteria bacterium]
MDSVEIVDLAREGIWVLMLVGMPTMLTALVVGLAISLVQALTQVQESTLTFVPKLVAMLLVMMLAMPYMLQSLEDYGEKLFNRIATIE